MPTFCLLIFLTGIYPWWRAWSASRHTSLRHALLWGLASWAVWGWAFAADVLEPGVVHSGSRYLALCLTGCAAVAVLGARWPGVQAWNFVVVGLLAVLLLPMAQSLLLGGEHERGGLSAWFLTATLAVGVLNYLPTRLGLAAVLLAIACGGEAAALLLPANGGGSVGWSEPGAGWLLALVPWAALGPRSLRRPRSEFDRLWLEFRDRFGLVWGQRLREQFNRSAAHAGWPVVLGWTGLRPATGGAVPECAAQLATLRALLKRFGPPPSDNNSEGTAAAPHPYQ